MTEKKSWYRDWFNSPYYHLLYFKRDEREAAEFIDLLINHLQPSPGATMLDVACGKGRHSIQLASKGYDVTGIDLSQESILEASKFEQENLHFFVHDMRLPFRTNYYDYAFNFFTSFGYFNTRREHDNAIRTIANSVRTGGTFVLDFLNVQFAEANTEAESELEINSVSFRISKWYDDTHFYKRIVVMDPLLDEPLVHEERVAKFTLEDFREIFSHHHLEIGEVFGDYHFNPYDEKKSPRLIVIAKKTQ